MVAEISFAIKTTAVEKAGRVFAVEQGKTQVQNEFAAGVD